MTEQDKSGGTAEAPILIQTDAGVLRVTLNRPDKLNALTPPMVYRLREALTAAARDPAVRCVLIAGAGRAFCSGGDVWQFSANDPADPVAAKSSSHVAWSGPEYLADRLRERAEVALLLHTMPKPTVAMLRGPAMGAGLSLASACDIRIADDTAIFGTAFARVGLSGDYGASYFLTKLVGPSLAREMYFLNRRLDAAEAKHHGLVNRMVEAAALEATALAIASELAAGPPVAWRAIKQNLVAAETERLESVLDVEARNMIRTMATADAKGAIEAFLNKKIPSFDGY
jgi:2-(1,2-epoxy-1,2-dihydrophenyl)acetyl-CoA isomerase